MERQTIIQLIMAQQILSDAVHDEMQEFVFLVQEESDGEISNLLFRVFCGRNEVDRFEMAEVDIPAEYVNVEKLRGSV